MNLSASQARLLLPPSCPAKFKERMDNPPTKREFDLGSLAHKLVLGEGSDIVLVAAENWKTKAAQEAREKAHTDDKIPCLPHELANAERMAAAVHDHPIAGALFADGDAEMVLRVEDPMTGVVLSGRPDWITPVGSRLCIVEYKSSQTAEPRGFFRKAADFGYHIQAAAYRRLLITAGMDEDPDFLFVAQEKESPHLVSVVRPDVEAMRFGERCLQAAIEAFSVCTASGVWPGYSDVIHEGSLPPWAFRDNPATSEE